jgi:hypothetical protein
MVVSMMETLAPMGLEDNITKALLLAPLGVCLLIHGIYLLLHPRMIHGIYLLLHPRSHIEVVAPTVAICVSDPPEDGVNKIKFGPPLAVKPQGESV